MAVLFGSKLESSPALAALSAANLNLPNRKLPTLSLEQCVSIGLQQATQVLKAQNQVHFSGEQLLQAYTQFLPNVDAQGYYSYQNGTDYFTAATPTLVVGQNVGVGSSLSSRLNLFNGLADLSNFKLSELKSEGAKLTLHRAKQAIALDITQSYLQAILDQEIAEIAKMNLKVSEERQKLLDAQTKVGSRNLSELFRQQAQTSADELLWISSVNKQRNQQITLLKKLRLDVAKDYELLKPTIPKPQADPQFQDEVHLLELGLEKRADLKAANQLADAGEWGVKKSQAAYYPKLDLGLNVYSMARYLQHQNVGGLDVTPSSQRDFLDQLGSQTYYTLGLTLTFNLFNRGKDRLEVAKARVAADNLQLDAADCKLRLQAQVRQSHGDYQTTLQQVRSSEKGLAAAMKAYEVTQGRYEVGAANFVDLTTTQTALFQARSNRIQALIDFLLQGKVLEYVLGLTEVS